MITIVKNGAYLHLGGTDISEHVEEVRLAIEVNEDGLKSGVFNFRWRAGVTADIVEDIVSGELSPFRIRATPGAVSMSNPEWSGRVYSAGWRRLSEQTEQGADVIVYISGAIIRHTY